MKKISKFGDFSQALTMNIKFNIKKNSLCNSGSAWKNISLHFFQNLSAAGSMPVSSHKLQFRISNLVPSETNSSKHTLVVPDVKYFPTKHSPYLKSVQCSLSLPPENIRFSLVLRGYKKGNLGYIFQLSETYFKLAIKAIVRNLVSV